MVNLHRIRKPCTGSCKSLLAPCLLRSHVEFAVRSCVSALHLIGVSAALDEEKLQIFRLFSGYLEVLGHRIR